MSEVIFKGIKPNSTSGNSIEFHGDDFHALLIFMLNFAWEEWGKVLETSKNVSSDNFQLTQANASDACTCLAKTLQILSPNQHFYSWYINEGGFGDNLNEVEKDTFTTNMICITEKFIQFLKDCGGCREVI